MTPRFEEERARFRLCYRCEDCGHYDAPRDLCRHGWPLLDQRARGDEPPAEVVFCKEFELC
jgi:hypothetical protein